MADGMSSNSISCQDVGTAVKECVQLESTVGKICNAMNDFCGMAEDAQKMGANIAEAMPIVVSLREAVKQAQKTSEEHVRRMGGYLRILEEDSTESINLD